MVGWLDGCCLITGYHVCCHSEVESHRLQRGLGVFGSHHRQTHGPDTQECCYTTQDSSFESMSRGF